MDTEGSGASRAGGDGIHNEDSFLVEEGLGLYVVCDGASARPGGEVASGVAATALEEFVERAGEQLELRGDRATRGVVARAMRHALCAVEEAEAADPELEGLTTTVTLLLAHRDRGVIGHRGDSRAYLIRRGRVQQLTVDHELSEVMGDREEAEGFDVFGLDLEPGDTVVLCTDGAEEAIGDAVLGRVAGDLSPRILSSRIVSAANRMRPDRDATAVVVRVRGESEPGWLELSQPPRGTSFGHTLELA